MIEICKKQLLENLLSELHKSLAVAIDSAWQAREASTNEESKAENKYDTRGLEASYLASGQSQRAKELQERIYHLQRCEPKSFGSDTALSETALVKVLINESEEKVFFLISAGGLEVNSQGLKIRTLSHDSPLGSHIWGLRVGDDFQFRGQFYEVTEAV